MKVITSGVYFLYRKGTLVYVGESGNIFERIGKHIKEKLKDFDEFEYMELEEIERKEMEAFLINIIRPEYNMRGGNHQLINHIQINTSNHKSYIKSKDKEYKDMCIRLYDEIENSIPLGKLYEAMDTTYCSLYDVLIQMEAPIFEYTYNHREVEKTWLYKNLKELYKKVREYDNARIERINNVFKEVNK